MKIFNMSDIIKTGTVKFTYNIVEKSGERFLELRSHSLPDDLYNSIMDIDLECSSPLCESFCHEITPDGDWILGCLKLK